ncbi:MAG TPA: PQQ-binding-like beta-propeller repeat protein [Polyangiaceae bacterium]|nr:PQQ-binding-like beta-propeller repeat protein [Polyangiaceae bacterium]
MTAIHVVLRSSPERASRSESKDSRGHFDVVVDGINVTARVGDGQALGVIAELGTTLVELMSGRRNRAVVQLYSQQDAWELGLEVDGRHALLTVFKGGQAPELAVAERRVELVALRHALLDALGSAKNAKSSPAVSRAIGLAHQLLSSVPVTALPARPHCEVSITPRPVRSFAFRAEARLRSAGNEAAFAGNRLERSDLHALLFLGSFGVAARGRIQTIGEVPVFLIADRLVELAGEALSARQQARPLFRRYQIGAVRVGVRLAPVDAPMAFSLGSADSPTGSGLTFPDLDPVVFAQAVVLFVRSLRDAILAADPSQAYNLRLTDLANAANSLAEQAQPSDSESALTNPRPEEYRRFAIARVDSQATGHWDSGVPVRFSPRWTATVPNIDLKSVIPHGEHFIIGALRETACLARRTGEVLWRKPLARAGTLAIPNGFVRLHPDGRVSVHDIETGETRFGVRLAPRAGGGAAGAVVLAPGLPKLIAIAEGDRRITAVDLVSGEIRWRYTARRPAPLRVRRAGRLLLVGGGDSVLVALDAISGETIWRAADRVPFTGDVAVDAEDAFILAAGAQGRGNLHHYDACTGELRWTAVVEDRPLIGVTPILTPTAVVVAVRDARGSGARAFDRKSGEELWNIEPGQLPRQSAWLGIDELVVVNGTDATVTAIEAKTGALRYRHVLSRPLDPDIPRQTQPVLRSGALFVPQQQVIVMRPRDGQMLGTVPTDLLPDVVRVDEQSAVYVAEESGHVACFASAPKLVRVK